MMSSREDWKDYKLGEVAQYLNGKAFKPSDWGKDGLPIIRIQNLTDANKPFNYFAGDVEERYRVKPGDLLVAWSATLGSFIWERGPAVLNQHIFKVLPNSRIVEKEFLHYLILNTLDEMASHAHGLAMKHITKKKFEGLTVSIPSLDEQRRIVDGIKECFERVGEVEALRQEAIAEADAVLPSMLSEAFAGLGDSCEEVAIGDVAEETRYGTSEKCTTVAEGTAILRIPNVADGFVNFNELKYRALDERELAKLSLQDGDLLFVRTNGSRDLVGRCAIFEGDGNGTPYGFASYLIRVRLNKLIMRPHYLAFFLNSTHGRAEIDRRRRTSAGQYNINSENLRSIRLPLPAIDVQDQLIEALTDQQATVIDLQREVAEAHAESESLRQSVLHNAFAGKL